MNTDIPATVSADTVESWSDDVDVVVIGFGIGGGCAAVSAAAAGARVLVLERAGVAGGTTSLAGGHFYLGGGTAVQQATGHSDSPEEMYKYLVAASRRPDNEKIRVYSDGSVEHFNWLEDLGFQFERSYVPGKVVVPAGTEGLSYTGNEKVWPYCEQAKPAPRGHSVPVPGELGGAAMVVDLLLKRADDLGVQIRYETGATNLILDDDGAVVGAAWKHFTETGAVKAKAVIIAAGGFVMNPDMVAEILRQLMKEALLLAAPILIASALLSFVLSLVQTLTSLQDQSLTSVPRLIAVALILLVAMPWFLGRMADYTRMLFTDFHRYLG